MPRTIDELLELVRTTGWSINLQVTPKIANAVVIAASTAGCNCKDGVDSAQAILPDPNEAIRVAFAKVEAIQAVEVD